MTKTQKAKIGEVAALRAQLEQVTKERDAARERLKQASEEILRKGSVSLIALAAVQVDVDNLKADLRASEAAAVYEAKVRAALAPTSKDGK